MQKLLTMNNLFFISLIFISLTAFQLNSIRNEEKKFLSMSEQQK
jgi:hypothetical protein